MSARPKAPASGVPPVTTLAVRLTPRAFSFAVQRYENGALFLRLTAPPVEGQANDACCRFVAKLLDLAPSQVSVRSGHKSRDKVLEVAGAGAERVREILARYAQA